MRKSILILAVSASVVASAAGPELRFIPNDTITLGLISGKEIEERTVRAVNSGDEPLAILFSQSDCSCTVADYSKKPLAPGDTTEITVRFDPRGRRHGRFSKVVRFRTNATPPGVALFIKGSIERPIVK